MDGSRREIEGVAMPVQHRRGQFGKRRGNPCCGQFDRPPPDLLYLSWINPGPQRGGDQLRAKTYPQEGLLPGQSSSDQSHLLLQERIAGTFVGPNRSP